MPNRKRSPIEYKAQFGEGVFRPREVVEAELAGASAEGKDNIGSIPPVEVPRGKRPVTGRTNGRTVERTIVRHSFDIGQDQLLALTELQTRRFGETGKKPKVGTLVQEALDAYIAQHLRRSNERTNGKE